MSAALDQALDAACAEVDREDWLAVRRNGFGASDLPILWLILGWVPADDLETFVEVGDEKVYTTPRYFLHQAEITKHVLVPVEDPKPKGPKRRRVEFGFPRLIAEKLGLVAGGVESDAQAEGKFKERMLFEQSRLGQWDTEAFYAPAEDWPLRLWGDRLVSTRPAVLRDAVEPSLLCTVEAWENTPKGVVAWELKTDRCGEKTAPTWYWRVQSRGQATVLGAAAHGIQYGGKWARTDSPAFSDLPDAVQFGPFLVTDHERALCRQAAAAGAKMMEDARSVLRKATTR